MRWILRFLIVSGIGLLATVGYIWWTMLSPFSYQFPEEMAPSETVEHRVFVYGTLTHAPVRWLVKGRAGNPEAYTLSGYRKEGLDLTPDAQGQVEGLLLEVSAGELRRLDRYERLGVRYIRDQIILSDGEAAWVYLRMPAD